MSEVFQIAGREIIDADDGVALGQQAIGEVRAKKSGGAGDKHVLIQVFMLQTLFNSSRTELCRASCACGRARLTSYLHHQFAGFALLRLIGRRPAHAHISEAMVGIFRGL